MVESHSLIARYARVRRLSQIFAYAACIVGAVVMVRWFIHGQTPDLFLADFAWTKFNTALGFLLMGAALLVQVRRPRLALGMTVLVLLIGLLSFAEYQFGWSLGIDELFIRDLSGSSPGNIPGRMSFLSAVNFCLLGLAALLMQRSKGFMTANILICLAILAAFLAIVGDAFGVREFYTIVELSSMNILTALTFILLSMALLFAYPDQGLMRVATSFEAGGILSQRLLLIVIIFPMVLAWLLLVGLRAGLYDVEFGLATFAIVNIFVYSVLVLWIARSVNALDSERSEAFQALHDERAILESKVAERTEELAAINRTLETEIEERWRSQFLYRTVVENLPDTAVIMFDRNLRFVVADGPVMPRSGFSREKMLGRTLFEVLPPDRYDSLVPLYGRVLAGESLQSERESEGNYYDSRFVPVIDSNGQITHGLIVIEDVTARKNAETALRNSEEQFRATFDYAAIGMSIVSLDGRWLRVNDAVCQIVGYTPEELISKTFQEITYPEDLQEDLRQVERLLSGEIKSYQMEQRYIHRDGYLTWVLLSVALVRDSTGKPLHFISQVKNINDRKRAEAALAKERNILRTLIDSLPDYIFVKDSNGAYLVNNTAHATALGVSDPGRLLGKTDFEFFPEASAARFTAQDDRVITHGEVLVDLEELEVGKDGISFAALTTKVPLRNPDGEVIGLVGITRDISHQKQAEIALQHNERLLRTVLTNLPVGVIVTDPSGKPTFGNRAMEQMWGGLNFEAQDDYKAWWTETGQPIALQDWPAVGAMATGESTINREIEIERFDGIRRFILHSAVPIQDSDNQNLGSVIVNQDITDIREASLALKKINEELAQANEEVQNFAYIVSHDLRAPLINLKGFSGVLQNAVNQIEMTLQPYQPHFSEQAQADLRAAMKEKIPTALRFISTSVDRMDGFTSAILKLSRLGRHLLTVEPVSAQDVVSRILQSLSDQLEREQITVVLDALPELVTDRVALDQILSNVIVNAVKYLDPERAGYVHISAKEERNHVTFLVRDNGRGIAKMDYEKVFAPFRRAGRPTVDGEGMGLAYVQALVRRLQGRIWFESEVNVGTTFSIMLPKTAEAAL
jgi:PAS domain S-box-containing protein